LSDLPVSPGTFADSIFGVPEQLPEASSSADKVTGQSRIVITTTLHAGILKEQARRRNRDTVAGRARSVSHPVYVAQRIAEMTPGGNANNVARTKSPPHLQPFNFAATASFLTTALTLY